MVLGLTPQGRPDRYRRELMSAHERVSLTAVIEAVSDVIEAANRHGIVDRALASRIGAQIHLAVAQAVGTGRISSGADLLGQQAFRTILGQHLASADSSYADQQARQSLVDFMRRHANRTSADFAVFVAQFRRGGGYADRGERDGSSLLTSARYDGFSGADAAQLAAMRRFAIDNGLGWAADRPEILRMGEEAIRLLARTGFTRQSHDRLHEAGFNHQDMVRIARFAERTGQNVNEIASETATAVDSFSAGSPESRQRWIGLFRRFYENPGNLEAQQEMNDALTEIETRGTDEQRDRARRMREITGRASEARLTADTETDAARAAREAREAEARAREAEEARLAADRARYAALLGEDTPTKGPATVVQESPAKKAAAQEGPPAKLAEARPPAPGT